jgi:hypothetical protein
MSARRPLLGKPDIAADMAVGPLLTDAVEKVGSTASARNNRIPGDDFLNRPCAFSGRLESMLLGVLPQIFFQQYRSQSGLKLLVGA